MAEVVDMTIELLPKNDAWLKCSIIKCLLEYVKSGYLNYIEEILYKPQVESLWEHVLNSCTGCTSIPTEYASELYHVTKANPIAAPEVSSVVPYSSNLNALKAFGVFLDEIGVRERERIIADISNKNPKNNKQLLEAIIDEILNIKLEP